MFLATSLDLALTSAASALRSIALIALTVDLLVPLLEPTCNKKAKYRTLRDM